jgi:hypothetical protein
MVMPLAAARWLVEVCVIRIGWLGGSSVSLLHIMCSLPSRALLVTAGALFWVLG